MELLSDMGNSQEMMFCNIFTSVTRTSISTHTHKAESRFVLTYTNRKMLQKLLKQALSKKPICEP